MLNAKQLKELTGKLQEEEKRLVTELSSFADTEDSKDYTARYIDFGDSDDDNIEEYRQHDLNLSLEKRFEEELHLVKKALAKIKKGKYGKCENCKKDIDFKRLQAFPAATFCMDCNAKFNKK